VATIPNKAALDPAFIEAREKARSPIEQRILEAAASVFGEKGFHAARTADIAKLAKTTERTLFKYFPTKTALYGETLLPALASIAMVEGMRHTGDLFDTDSTTFRAWQDNLLSERLRHSEQIVPQIKMLLVSLLTDDEMRSWFNARWKTEVWDHAVHSLRKFQDRGLLRRDVDLNAAARLIISVNLGYVLTRLVLAPEIDWNETEDFTANGDFLSRALCV
jgi:AcrR family transcriptional regulator